MTDSSLWHRINPFHHRPHSSQARYTPAEDRDPSIDLQPPRPTTSAEPTQPRYPRDVHTPAPFPPSPSKQRTPSILRTLAHHPSLSALKSRSRRRKAKLRSPLPPVPRQSRSSEQQWGNSRAERDDPSPSPYSEGRDVRGSRSIPRDLRLSRESYSSTNNEEIPPVPPSPAYDFGQGHKRLQKVKRAGSTVRRKPVPSTSPSITLQAPEVTPETVRVRRMRFQFDLSMDDSPTKSRRRAASHSEVDISPPKSATGSSRHLSTPAPPSPLRAGRSQYASYQHPFTTQHPHPVPLTLSPRPYQDATFYPGNSEFDHDSDDLVPVTDPEGYSEDDGLDLLVRQEEVPVGTPGGKRGDLRRGALLDGAKHEKNAIRFFSRDMYAPPSSSSCSSTPSLAPMSIARTSIDRQDKRSSSPFEVKLSPLVSKRISLDAFGTPSPLGASQPSTQSTDSQSEILAEESVSGDEKHGEDDSMEEVGYQFQNAPLSTIGEHAFGGDSDGPPGDTPCTQKVDTTEYFTPSIAESERQEGVQTPRSSPTLHAQLIRHLSAPPLSITQELFNAHGQSSLALQVEVETARKVIEELELENEMLRAHFGQDINVVEHDDTKEERLHSLEKVLKDKDEELDEINCQIREQAEEHGLTTSQLRNALRENEGFFEALREAHDDYAEQLQELREAHAQLAAERSQGTVTLEQLKIERDDLRSQVAKFEADSHMAEATIAQIQRSLHEFEFQLSTVNDDHANVISTHRAEFEEMKLKLQKSEERVSELDDLLKAGLGRESELHRANQQLRQKDERIRELQNRQTGRQKTIDTLTEQMGDRDAELANLQGQVDDLLAMKKGAEHDLKAALQSTTVKDSIIGVLRDKMRTAGFEKDELVANAALKEEEHRAKVQGLEERIKADAVEREHLEEEVHSVYAQLEELSDELTRARDESGNPEAELKDREEEVASLQDGLAVTEKEKCELLELLNQMGDEDSISSIRAQLASTESELSAALRHIDSMSKDTEDLNVSLIARTTSLRLQDDELDFLRKALADAESAMAQVEGDSVWKAKEAARKVGEMSQELEDLGTAIKARDQAVADAVMDLEMERASSADLKSRLQSYLSEVDRLQLDKAKSTKQIEDLQRESADLELKVVEQTKKVESLESDKELLNVALESKQTELALFQRQFGLVTPRKSAAQGQGQGHGQGLAASTGRVAIRSMTTGNVTPVPHRRLSASVSHNSLRARRDGSTSNTLHAGATPRGKAPLSASTKHNRTPVKKVMSATPSRGGLSKRSSLPVLVGRNSADLGRADRPISRAEVGRVEESDEAVF